MKRLLPAGVLLIVVCLVGLLWFNQQADQPLVVSGTIEADDVRVGSRIGGRIAAVHVEEGDAVHVGDLLIELEPFDLQERAAQARHSLAAAEARLAKLTAGYRAEEIAEAIAMRDEAAASLEELRNGPRPQEIAAAQAQVELAEAELKNATRTSDRAETLFGKGAATESDLDDALTKLSVAKAMLEDRRQKLALLKVGTRAEQVARGEASLRKAEQVASLREHGFRSEEIDEARAQRDEAAAALAVIEKQVVELAISAPIDGAVEAVDLLPGDIVAPNAPVISLIETGRLRVRAYVPENRLNLQTGDAVEVTVDSFPDERFEGEITFIAREAEFTPGNVQTPEERSKQVFRIRVQLTTGLDRLRPGMAADVHLDVAKGRP